MSACDANLPYENRKQNKSYSEENILDDKSVNRSFITKKFDLKKKEDKDLLSF